MHFDVRHLDHDRVCHANSRYSKLIVCEATRRIRTNQARVDQTRPGQIISGQIRSDRTRPDQTRPDQTRPDHIRSDQIRSVQARPGQARPVWPRTDQIQPLDRWWTVRQTDTAAAAGTGAASDHLRHQMARRWQNMDQRTPTCRTWPQPQCPP